MPNIMYINYNFHLFIFVEPSANYESIVEMLRSENISKEDFDLYWRKSSPLRFKHISESKSTSEVFNLWPEYKNPSALQLVSVITKLHTYNLVLIFYISSLRLI